MIGNHLHLEYGYNTVKKKQALGVKLKNMPNVTFWHCFVENVPYTNVISPIHVQITTI